MTATYEIGGVSVAGVCSCLPETSDDSLERCRKLYGDAAKAESVVKATGIRARRIAAPGTTPLDLCGAAAEELLQATGTDREAIGAVVFVTFTADAAMPASACRAQARLGLRSDVLAFDVGLACSGYVYGLYLSALLVKSTGKKVLLLDGDVQSARLDGDDEGTVPVLADAGTATILSPDETAAPWTFGFLTKGEAADGGALRLPFGGKIAMDGFGVYRFVAADVTAFLREFMAKAALAPEAVGRFVPHQANVYMVRQLAKALKIAEGDLLVSGDEVGNSASATIPVTISRRTQAGERLLLAGFGGGLSAAAARVALSDRTVLRSIDFGAR